MTTIQSDVKCEIVVPVELREHVEQFTKAYADTLVFKPFLSWGKVVMEQGSSSHAQAFVVRFLLQALYGKLPTTFDELKAIRETNRWENWMVTAHGSYVLGSDMSLSSTTLSVHRADGWEDVYDDVFNKGAARQPTDPPVAATRRAGYVQPHVVQSRVRRQDGRGLPRSRQQAG